MRRGRQMECIKALVVALVLGGCARASPIHDAQERAVIGDWVSAITDTCQRCASAKWDRGHAPVSLPERAVVYSFTGEFATRVQWWLINLDTGEITEREAISSADAVWKTETKHFGIVESEA